LNGPGGTVAVAALVIEDRQPEQVRDVLRPELSHESRPVALECSVADLQPHPTLLVGTAFPDKAKHLGLARGQRYLMRRNSLQIGMLVADVSDPRPPPDHLATLREGSLLPQRRLETVAKPAHQRTHVFGFSKRVLRDLLQ